MLTRLFFYSLSILLTCIGCKSGLPSVTLPRSTSNNEIIYHVVQRSFSDSNGDKHGDLEGLRRKLPYLRELGVTSILLLPLYHSEYYHNYFATDFEKIDPEFGTEAEFLALVKDVHQHGMKIYMDMETQYVTEDHLWYRDSYENPASPYSSYLVYNGPGNTNPESIIWDLTKLEGYDGTVRTITTVDLRSPEVLAYNQGLFAHWVDPNKDGLFDDGVDGFRLDHMMDDLDWKGKFTNLFQNFWRPLIDSMKVINPKLVFLAEQANWEDFGTDYITEAHVDRVFGFRLAHAIASLDKFEILKAADTTFKSVSDPSAQIVFLENHDTRRFATAVESNPGKLRLGASLNLLLGGTPLIYYGQEIGMRGEGGFGAFGNTDGNDIPRREAFEWYRSVSGEGMALWYENTGPWWDQRNITGDDGISLEEQRHDHHSLWNVYKDLIALRRLYPVLVDGTFREAWNDHRQILSFYRETDSTRMLIIANLGPGDMDTEIPMDSGYQKPVVVWGHDQFIAYPEKLSVELPSFAIVVLKL